MRVIVTGSSGSIGRYVVFDLVANDHNVLSVDVVPAETTHQRVDLTDADQVREGFDGFRPDAVVHLGAWPNPGHVPDARTYGDNTTGTFNVFQARADLGVLRVVSASTGQVYGLVRHPPDYVRLDEAHPLQPVNCYAESKIAGESAARYFSENAGITVLSFRFMGIRRPTEIGTQIEQMARDPSSGTVGLWTRTDARDAAMACRRAVEVAEVMAGAYNISGPCIALDIDAADLVREHFGEDVGIKDLSGADSPLNCDKARHAFGYEPCYPWTLSCRHDED